MSSAAHDTIESHSFTSPNEGPHLLVLGAIHGTEKAGTRAIRCVMERLNSGALTLEKGTVTFLPVANPKAFAQGIRFCDINLNRVIGPHAAPSLYEEKIANQILPLIDASDVLLDLHSFQAQGVPFIFQDGNTETDRALALCLGPRHIITGWTDLSASSGDLAQGTTVDYALSLGKTGITVECGQHEEPHAQDVGIAAILNMMAFYGLCADSWASPGTSDPVIARVKQAFPKKREGSFTNAWKHFDAVRAGESIATFDDGETLTAPKDSLIILPNSKVQIGGEWFYLGEKEV